MSLKFLYQCSGTLLLPTAAPTLLPAIADVQSFSRPHRGRLGNDSCQIFAPYHKAEKVQASIVPRMNGGTEF